EMVGVQGGGRVRARGAAEEERVLAGRKDEQLGDLVAQALRVERGGDRGENHETPDVAPHRPSGPGMNCHDGSKRLRTSTCVNPGAQSVARNRSHCASCSRRNATKPGSLRMLSRNGSRSNSG